MLRLHRLGIGLVALLLTACTHQPPGAVQNHGVVYSYVEAYNQRDLAGMAALMHDEVEWLSIDGSDVTVMARGKADLVTQMEAYFASPQVTQSSIEALVVDGDFRSARERAHWVASDGQTQSQSSLAVYQLEDGLIRRVWYYPASK